MVTYLPSSQPKKEKRKRKKKKETYVLHAFKLVFYEGSNEKKYKKKQNRID